MEPDARMEAPQEEPLDEENLWDAAFNTGGEAESEDVVMSIDQKLCQMSRRDPMIAAWAAEMARKDKQLGDEFEKLYICKKGQKEERAQRDPNQSRSMPRLGRGQPGERSDRLGAS